MPFACEARHGRCDSRSETNTERRGPGRPRDRPFGSPEERESMGGRMRVHARARNGTAMALVLLALAAPAPASPSLVGGGGFDYYQGPGGEFTRSALGILGASGVGGSATLTLMRYADNLTGDGTGYVGSVGAPLTPSPGPSRGPLLGLRGGGGAGAPRTQAGARVDPLLQLGVRVLLP